MSSPEEKAKKAPAATKTTAKKDTPKKRESKADKPKGEGTSTKTKAPRRPTLEPKVKRLLVLRGIQDSQRPRFTRQASYRYYRIGRDGTWRRPRGLQSKQRRHYGYRSQVVSVGFRGPRNVRGLTPTGFRPVLVHTGVEVERIDPVKEAALIAHSVGTKKRLVLEEVARKRGVHLLNPLSVGSGEE